MQGRTHVAVGIAAALALAAPSEVPALAAGCCAAALGGLMPDIDSEGSVVHRVEAWTAGIVLAVILFETLAGERLGVRLPGAGLERAPGFGLGLAALLALWVLGHHTPHRSFTHSILGGGLFAWAFRTAFPDLAGWFAVAYAAHLAADFLNRRGEALFFPLKKRYCLHLCPSDGRANAVLLWAGIGLSVVLFGLRAAGR